MNKATIKVQYVNQPKNPKGPGSVKTADGVYYKVWKDLLPKFPGPGTYEVEYDTEDYNGKPQHTVRSVIAASTSTTTNGNTASTNGNRHTGNGNGSTSDQIRWQTCLKVAGTVLAGGGVGAGDVIVYARKLFAADPIVEAAKEIFNATEAPTGDEAPNW